MAEIEITRVDFHFDIICPWAFQASLWMREVRELTGTAVTWKFFSLEEINREEGRKHPWERPWSYGWSMMRIGALLRRDDPELLDRWYLAAGSALHLHGRKPHRKEVAEEILGEMGLDPGLVDKALEDDTTGEEVRREHEEGVSRGYFGVPTLYFPEVDQSLFGPVLIDPPRGEKALALWRHLLGWFDFPRLYEIKRPKTADDIVAIGKAFSPYLEARDWKTVQKPAP